MLKNFMLIALGAGLAILILGVAGFAFAQTQTPPSGLAPNWTPSNSGMGRWNGGGMMGRWHQVPQGGFMHDYLVSAIAPKLGLSVDALQTELAAGKTLWQIAEAKGYSVEQFQSMLLDAKKEALSKMVAAGVITQAQAEWMLSRMNWMFQNGGSFGSGRGPCHGGRWGGQGGRWAPTPTPGSGS